MVCCHSQWVSDYICSCTTIRWSSRGVGGLSASMWSHYLDPRLNADPLVALSRSQRVRDLTIWIQDWMLTLSWPCPALSLYVISLFGSKTKCWPSCGLVALSESMWSHYLDSRPNADPLVALSCSQEVCDLTIWIQDQKLTFLWPCPALRKYVISQFGSKTKSWLSCGLVPLSGSMWSCNLDLRPNADPLVALSCSQLVCDLAIWIQDQMLTLLWPYPALSWYVISLFGSKTKCWPSCGLVSLSESMWSHYVDPRPNADLLVALSHSQEVHDLAIWIPDQMLTFSWLCPALSLYVILLFWSKTDCWPSHGLVPLSGSMWSRYLDPRPNADLLVALSHSQFVCDLAIWIQDWMLTLSWPCPTLSGYVISLFGSKTECWPSRGLVPLSASTWSHYLDPRLNADPLVALSRSQRVCNLAIWTQDRLLTLSWPCPVLREYVILLFGSKTKCWPSHGLVLLSGSMWSCYLDPRPNADPLTALSCSQEVHDLTIWIQDWMLTLSWPCPALRMYVILLFGSKIKCWPSRGLVPLSVCMWSCYLDPRLNADPLTTLSHS